MCHIVPICHFFGGLNGFLMHCVSHHSYLCGVEVYHTQKHWTTLYLSIFLLALRKWSPCWTLGLTDTIDVRVCVVHLDLGFVAFIFCRVLRELKNIVVVARWLFVVTGRGRLENHTIFTRIITYKSISKNTWLAIRVNLHFSNNISPNLLGLSNFLQNNWIVCDGRTDRQTN